MIMNCLVYALRFWLLHPEYTIVYNQDHVINIPEGSYIANSKMTFTPLEDESYSGLLKAFNDFLSDEDKAILDLYLKLKKNNIKI